VRRRFSASMSPTHNNGGRIFSMYSQSVHYRRLAIQAKQRAVQASDSSVAVALEEIANHWTALAEQVEWLQEKMREATRRRDRSTPSSLATTQHSSSTSRPRRIALV
jgi:hypothetical protein